MLLGSPRHKWWCDMRYTSLWQVRYDDIIMWRHHWCSRNCILEQNEHAMSCHGHNQHLKMNFCWSSAYTVVLLHPHPVELSCVCTLTEFYCPSFNCEITYVEKWTSGPLISYVRRERNNSFSWLENKHPNIEHWQSCCFGLQKHQLEKLYLYIVKSTG